MADFALKSLIRASAGITALGLLAGFSSVAEAAVFKYGFEVAVTQGSNIGETYRGTFQFDSSKMTPCFTNPALQCATPANGDLALTFNYQGNTYTQADDVDYTGVLAQFPAVYYYPELEQRGFQPYLLSFIVMPAASPSFSILGFGFFTDFASVGEAADPGKRIGDVSYFRDIDPAPDPPPDTCETKPELCTVEAAPEPSEIAGSVVAVVLLTSFWRSRRRRSNLKL